jgi:nicotinate-nucleotide--dimethylbenzimidazole phosphoribosyltransferase
VGTGPLPVAGEEHRGRRPPIPIVPVDERARAAVRARLVSLGRLADLAGWLAGVTARERPALRARLVVAAVGPGPEDGRLRGAAREAGVEVVVVDPGVTGRGLGDEPAMTVGEVALAVDTGREAAARAAGDRVTVLAGGALGSGSAIAAGAVAAALTGGRASPGAPERALAVHAPRIDGPLGALRRLGAGDVALLCGVALGAGEHGLGFVCDGLVATAGAAVAAGIEPSLLPRLLAGHRAPDPAHGRLLAHLGLEPVLDLAVEREDGSGAIAALALLRVAGAAAPGRSG